ncbi:hypothetical protein [Cupriavidus sp. amp6]|uniref:hypothetical protein n=1 Tax=Cupriavidus sp. amp6 TaxID=388051 RepID=UPI001E3F1FE4|nr:hypothetical protein [Cupriavidus sp. amp6]
MPYPLFMPLYQSDSILLEAFHFGDGAESLRLPCGGVSIDAGALIVHGIEPDLLRSLRWTPDFLSFEAHGTRHRYPVSRPALVGPAQARFALL